MKKIKWGIVGLGKIANKFAKDLLVVQNAELYAVASRNLEKAEAFKKEYQAQKAYGSYEELMEDKAVDVVYVATPHVLHHSISVACMKKGIAVLCEKPFAMNTEEVKEMIKTARENKVFLMEAMWTRFLPHFEFMLMEINSGKMGKIKSIKADFGFPAEFDVNGRLFNKSLGGGSLLDIGIYPVFLAYSLLGKPDKIEAEAKFAETGVDSSCEIKFHYKNGATALLESTVLKKTPTTAEIELEKGNIFINSRFHEPSSINILMNEEKWVKEFDVNTTGYFYEAEHVTQMLLEGKTESEKMSFNSSLDLIGLLDAIRKEIALEYDL
ncbi:oxidoreductase [Christiangramia fulva]|uniref:Oxidoreductase n=1 Tax=Christiangramia fulva TaxID=2126553 RepID=A0A2R3Z7E3_9FLAO|nr:Gfo/Idh/MocA family oxidoreductase [Christiangramia fulva]AVR46148.1 oxidoreductase [Christiangramia fulva]